MCDASTNLHLDSTVRWELTAAAVFSVRRQFTPEDAAVTFTRSGENVSVLLSARRRDRRGHPRVTITHNGGKVSKRFRVPEGGIARVACYTVRTLSAVGGARSGTC